jgi:hypothetical protein
MELTDVLRGGRQCDEDGTEIIMSREACVVAADLIERQQKALATLAKYFTGGNHIQVDQATIKAADFWSITGLSVPNA